MLHAMKDAFATAEALSSIPHINLAPANASQSISRELRRFISDQEQTAIALLVKSRQQARVLRTVVGEMITPPFDAEIAWRGYRRMGWFADQLEISNKSLLEEIDQYGIQLKVDIEEQAWKNPGFARFARKATRNFLDVLDRRRSARVELAAVARQLQAEMGSALRAQGWDGKAWRVTLEDRDLPVDRQEEVLSRVRKPSPAALEWARGHAERMKLSSAANH